MVMMRGPNTRTLAFMFNAIGISCSAVDEDHLHDTLRCSAMQCIMDASSASAIDTCDLGCYYM